MVAAEPPECSGPDPGRPRQRRRRRNGNATARRSPRGALARPVRRLPRTRQLAEVDARHRAAGRPVAARPSRAAPEPGWARCSAPRDGPCWSCLAHRLRAPTAPAEAPVPRRAGLPGPLPVPAPPLAAVRALGTAGAVLEAAKWVAGMRQGQQSALCTLDTRTLRPAHHPVSRRPQCPACGDPELPRGPARVRPPRPASRPKAAHGRRRPPRADARRRC